jgi:peptidyl-prolyl cis-trans isomerase C
MKLYAIALFFVATGAWAQAAPPALTPETVVAHIGDKPITAGEMMTVLQLSPPEAQKNLHDGKAFVEQFALAQKLAGLAEDAHLDQQSPAKETLKYQRLYTMAQAEMVAAQDAIPVPADDMKKFYETNQDRYTLAKFKLLFIHFSATPGTDSKGKKILTEPEAKAKIEKLLAEIRGGADFVKLVKEHSQDPESAARNGDFGAPIRRSDKLPEHIGEIIFALKPGQLSEPVRVSTGFYLFRLEEFTTEPFEKVRDDIFVEIRHSRFLEWLDKTQKSVEVKIDNPEFFKKVAANPLPTK